MVLIFAAEILIPCRYTKQVKSGQAAVVPDLAQVGADAALQSPSEGKRYLRKSRLVHTRISLRSIRATLARSRTRIAIGTATRKPSFQNQFTLLAYV
jgi:hypothetical protein